MKRYIVCDPDILGGTPVITGTRIPVEKILFFIKDGFNIDGILKMYPHVSKKTLNSVLDELYTLVDNRSNGSIS